MPLALQAVCGLLRMHREPPTRQVSHADLDTSMAAWLSRSSTRLYGRPTYFRTTSVSFTAGLAPHPAHHGNGCLGGTRRLSPRVRRFVGEEFDEGLPGLLMKPTGKMALTRGWLRRSATTTQEARADQPLSHVNRHGPVPGPEATLWQTSIVSDADRDPLTARPRRRGTRLPSFKSH